MSSRLRSGLTLVELLCVITIIMILAALSLGPASRILKRARAEQWSDRAGAELRMTVDQLRAHFQGRREFPEVTLEAIAAERLVGPGQLRFLQDRRVTFVPFAGSDPDDKVVLCVQLERGFLSDAGMLMECKGAITAPPE